jgi:hypothetical protein
VHLVYVCRRAVGIADRDARVPLLLRRAGRTVTSTEGESPRG